MKMKQQLLLWQLLWLLPRSKHRQFLKRNQLRLCMMSMWLMEYKLFLMLCKQLRLQMQGILCVLSSW